MVPDVATAERLGFDDSRLEFILWTCLTGPMNDKTTGTRSTAWITPNPTTKSVILKNDWKI